MAPPEIQIYTSAGLIRMNPASASDGDSSVPPIGSAATARDGSPGCCQTDPATTFVPRTETRQRVCTLSDLGAGERVRTAGLPFTRSTAPCTVRASCTNSTRHRTDSTRCAGIIQSAVPRAVPRGQQTAAHYCNRAW